jgi:hypothetical protein
VASNKDELLTAFRIDPDDLAANRDGRLGSNQVERLRRNIWLNALVVAPLQVALVLIVVLADPSAVGHVVIGGLFVLLTAAEVSWAVRIRRAIRNGRVQALRGPIKIRRSVQSGTWVTVGGKRNRLWAGSRYVADGGEYRVYVVPAVKAVVAMEPENWD